MQVLILGLFQGGGSLAAATTTAPTNTYTPLLAGFKDAATLTVVANITCNDGSSRQSNPAQHSITLKPLPPISVSVPALCAIGETAMITATIDSYSSNIIFEWTATGNITFYIPPNDSEPARTQKTLTNQNKSVFVQADGLGAGTITVRAYIPLCGQSVTSSTVKVWVGATLPVSAINENTSESCSFYEIEYFTDDSPVNFEDRISTTWFVSIDGSSEITMQSSVPNRAHINIPAPRLKDVYKNLHVRLEIKNDCETVNYEDDFSYGMLLPNPLNDLSKPKVRCPDPDGWIIGFMGYPNPASSVFNALSDWNLPYTYVVHNFLGLAVASGSRAAGEDLALDVSTWASGIYVLTLQQDGQVKRITFIVQPTTTAN